MATVAALAKLLGARAQGGGEREIDGVGSLTRATPSQITFVVDSKRATEIAASPAGAVIARETDATHISDRPVIVHADPYYAYALLAQHFAPRMRAQAGTHPSAVIDAGAEVDPSAEIGPFVYIASGARVAGGVRIHAGVRLGRGAAIGTDTELFPNVVIYPGCRIGARGIVHAGVVIGADGFGFAPHAGAWHKIPQTGKVIIGDDVEIGANTTIDRGALDDSVIGNGVKFDNQIQMGHNCTIGDHTAIAGCVGIAGSTHIGKHCMIGGAAMISGHLTICDRVIISAGTMVSNNITKPGQYTGVFPTVEHSAWRRMAVRVRKLAQ